MTWGVTSSKSDEKKQAVNSVTGQVPTFQKSSSNHVEVEPQTMYATRRAFVCGALVLVCGLLMLVAGIMREFAVYRMTGSFTGCSIWPGIIFTIGGTCAILAYKKQSRSRLIAATIFSILIVIITIIIIIYFGVCLAAMARMHKYMERMREMKGDDWKKHAMKKMEDYGKWKKGGWDKGDSRSSEDSDDSSKETDGWDRRHGKHPRRHDHRHHWPFPCSTRRPRPWPRPTGRSWTTPRHWPRPTGRSWTTPRYWPTGRPWTSPSPGPPRSWEPTRRPVIPTGYETTPPRRRWPGRGWYPTRRPGSWPKWYPRPTGGTRPKPEWRRPSSKPRYPMEKKKWSWSKTGEMSAYEKYKQGSRSWAPKMMCVAGIIYIIFVVIELVSAFILTIVGVRSLKANKYVVTNETVVVNVPADEKKVFADTDDLPPKI